MRVLSHVVLFFVTHAVVIIKKLWFMDTCIWFFCGGWKSLIPHRVQQLEIKPPHFTVFHHIHHFTWVKSQAIPSNILNKIGPSRSSRSSKLMFFFLPFALASKACLASLSWCILLTWPNHLSWDLSIWKSNGSMLRDFRFSELRTLLNGAIPSILRKNLVLDACTCDRTLSVIT